MRSLSIAVLSVAALLSLSSSAFAQGAQPAQGALAAAFRHAASCSASLLLEAAQVRAAASLSMMGRGVPAGAKRPNANGVQ
jgi:hypothetical protein